jgi:hypothetical protein
MDSALLDIVDTMQSDPYTRQDHAKGHPDKRKTSVHTGPSADCDKCKRIHRKSEVDNSISKTHIDGEEDELQIINKVSKCWGI